MIELEIVCPKCNKIVRKRLALRDDGNVYFQCYKCYHSAKVNVEHIYKDTRIEKLAKAVMDLWESCEPLRNEFIGYDPECVRQAKALIKARSYEGLAVGAVV